VRLAMAVALTRRSGDGAPPAGRGRSLGLIGRAAVPGRLVMGMWLLLLVLWLLSLHGLRAELRLLLLGKPMHRTCGRWTTPHLLLLSL